MSDTTITIDKDVRDRLAFYKYRSGCDTYEDALKELLSKCEGDVR